MSHGATERAGPQAAPGGLALVQDLLNTRAMGPLGADLLASVDEARRWLHEVLDPPGNPPDVNPPVVNPPVVNPPDVNPPDVNPPAGNPPAGEQGALGQDLPELTWVDELSDRDRWVLLELRSDLQRLVTGETLDTGPALIRTTVTISPAGELALYPAGRGPGWFVSAVWVQVFLAQQAGTWRRLKLCHHPPCGSAFYDRSKNNSGVWHDVRVCGNAVNLRASRARRRAATHRSTLDSAQR